KCRDATGPSASAAICLARNVVPCFLPVCLDSAPRCAQRRPCGRNSAVRLTEWREIGGESSSDVEFPGGHRTSAVPRRGSAVAKWGSSPADEVHCATVEPPGPAISCARAISCGLVRSVAASCDQSRPVRSAPPADDQSHRAGGDQDCGCDRQAVGLRAGAGQRAPREVAGARAVTGAVAAAPVAGCPSAAGPARGPALTLAGRPVVTAIAGALAVGGCQDPVGAL